MKQNKDSSSVHEVDAGISIVDKQPLLRALVRQAGRRSHTLTELAQNLGVQYRQLANWRSDERSIARAHRSVHERAAQYLGIPTVLVLVLAGTISLRDLSWPQEGNLLGKRVNLEIERMREDPVIGALAPPELEDASEDVRLFVAFLFDELNAGPRADKPSARWISILQKAIEANTDDRVELDDVLEQVKTGPSIF